MLFGPDQNCCARSTPGKTRPSAKNRPSQKLHHQPSETSETLTRSTGPLFGFPAADLKLFAQASGQLLNRPKNAVAWITVSRMQQAGKIGINLHCHCTINLH